MLDEEIEGGVKDKWPPSLGAQVGGPTPRRRLGVIELTDSVVAHFLLMVAFSYRK